MALTAQTIKNIQALQTVKGRLEANLFVAEGIRTVLSFIEAGHTPIALYLSENKSDLRNQISQSIHCEIISNIHMERISTSTTPSGILALFSIPRPASISDLSSGLVLAQIADPGNMGTLIRSAAAFGYHSVVIVEGCDPYAPKVIQATAGSLAAVTIFRLSWEQLIENKKHLSLCALVARSGKQPHELDLTNSLLVVGNEAHGLPEDWVLQCDTRLTLPMAGNVESLNAAVAGSIALFLGSQKNLNVNQ